MEKYWSLCGAYIGVRQRDYLLACDGTVLGKFYGKEVYNQEGCYIGELGKNNRLMKNKTKESLRRPGFSYGVRGTITSPLRPLGAHPVIYGFEDFS